MKCTICRCRMGLPKDLRKDLDGLTREDCLAVADSLRRQARLILLHAACGWLSLGAPPPSARPDLN